VAQVDNPGVFHEVTATDQIAAALGSA
jgi:hypothetical protein